MARRLPARSGKPGNISRRRLLRALGVSAAAAPFVPALEGWASAADEPKRRLLLLFSPHGVIPETYWPSGGEADFAFPTGGILEPLTPFKSKMLLVGGLKRDTRGPGDHERCFCNMWTGTALAPGSQEANGPSINQIVAKASKPPTEFESLQLAVQPHYTSDTDSTSRAGRSDGNMIYAGPKQRIPAEFDPYKLFDRLFMAGVGPGNQVDSERLRLRRQSVIDFVSQELADLDKTVLGREDRLKVESHLDGVRDVERRLQTPARTCGGITRPDGTLDINRGANFPQLIGIMNQLTAMAFACDRTRIASLQYSRGFSRHTHTWLGLKDWHHTISHNAGAKKELTAMQRWYMDRFKDLLDLLAGVTENGKPMLESMLVVYVNELNTPWNHAASPGSAWIVGNAAGAIPRLGRYLDFKNQYDHNQLLVTLVQAMGVTGVNRVGDLGSEGPIPSILS